MAEERRPVWVDGCEIHVHPTNRDIYYWIEVNGEVKLPQGRIRVGEHVIHGYLNGASFSLGFKYTPWSGNRPGPDLAGVLTCPDKEG